MENKMKRIIIINLLLLSLILYLSGYRFSKNQIYNSYKKIYNTDTYEIIYQDSEKSFVKYGDNMYEAHQFKILFPLVKLIDHNKITYPVEYNLIYNWRSGVDLSEYDNYLSYIEHPNYQPFIYYQKEKIDDNLQLKMSYINFDLEKKYINLEKNEIINDNFIYLKAKDKYANFGIYPSNLERYNGDERIYYYEDVNLQNIKVDDVTYPNQNLNLLAFKNITFDHVFTIEEEDYNIKIDLNKTPVLDLLYIVDEYEYEITVYKQDNKYFRLSNNEDDYYILDTDDFELFLSDLSQKLRK